MAGDDDHDGQDALLAALIRRHNFEANYSEPELPAGTLGRECAEGLLGGIYIWIEAGAKNAEDAAIRIAKACDTVRVWAT